MAAKTSEPGEQPQNPKDAARKRQGNIQVVEFVLGNELFAIDLFDVKEVVEYTTITKIPNVPAYVKGIIDLRGEITTDHRSESTGLNITEERSDRNRIIPNYCTDDKITATKIGILVDDVTSVSTFEAKQVDYTSASISNDDTSLIGIIKRRIKVKDKEKNELIIWIDIKQLLEDVTTSA